MASGYVLLRELDFEERRRNKDQCIRDRVSQTAPKDIIWIMDGQEERIVRQSCFTLFLVVIS